MILQFQCVNKPISGKKEVTRNEAREKYKRKIPKSLVCHVKEFEFSLKAKENDHIKLHRLMMLSFFIKKISFCISEKIH